MKILHRDMKHGEIRLQTENLDDLWYLSHIIEPEDLVKGQTERKIKLGKEDANQKVVKKKITLEIKTEKIEFGKGTDNLRVSGIIVQGPEDIPKGQHHTITVEDNTTIRIRKQHWIKYQLEKLKEAEQPLTSKILIAVFDREESHFALLTKQGFYHLSSIEGDVQKKGDDTGQKKQSFWKDIIKQLEEYDKRYKLNTIVLASPSFWKEELLKELNNDKLKKKMISATCSSAHKSAINEVLKRQETQQALKQDRISKELKLVEELLDNIAKEGNATYGINETKQAAEAGAVQELLVTDSAIRKARDKPETGDYKKIDDMMKLTDNMKGNINIISSINDAGKKLDGLGGIAAILRYKVEH